MYTKFFGFTKKPFLLTPDPEFLFLSSKHIKALTLLQYALASQSVFTVLSGEIGAGKTILIQSLLEEIEDSEVAVITNTHEVFGNLLTWILDSYHIEHKNINSEAERYQLFESFVQSKYQRNRPVILIIDEAQNMTAAMLEELRLLSNLNTAQQVMLQIILVGQTELACKLALPEQKQFSQRISTEYHLTPLSFDETQDYIRHRLIVAKGNDNTFDDMATAAIFYYSAGVPRVINNLCEMALVFAFADEKTVVDIATVLDVIKEKKYLGTQLPTESKDIQAAKDYVLQKTGIDISLI